MKDNRLAFWDYETAISKGDIWKLMCIVNQHTISVDTVAREAQEHHIKRAFSKCGYPGWAFIKARKMPNEPADPGKKDNCFLYENQWWSLWVSEWLKGFFLNTQHLFQGPQTSMDSVFKHKQRNIV